jgi:Dolichyl-phosphate-mannose-protein mannosyltransferase
MTDFSDADDVDDLIDRPNHGAVLDLSVIFAAAIAMCVWTWATWPDTLIDWGSQLYFAWQLSLGKLLYRDIAYFNGPFSEYFNAGLFYIFGVSQRVLWYANLAILASIILMLYVIVRRMSGRFVAVVCGIVFVCVFAFSSYVEVGNYNYVTPYTQEVTHGLALDLAAICLLMRYQRSRLTADVALAGLTMGVAFLTKAEVFAAGLIAVIAGFAMTLWAHRAGRAHVGRVFAAFLTTAIVPPVLALALQWQAMPFSTALRGTLGTWIWVFDRRMAQMSFYRHSVGLDQLGGNARQGLEWFGAYVLFFGAIAIAAKLKGVLDRRKLQTARTALRDRLLSMDTRIVVGVLIGAMFCGVALFGSLRCYDVARPLPIIMAAMFVVSVWMLGRTGRVAVTLNTSIEQDRLILRISLIVLASALLAKMALFTRIWHYGFVLAMPATLLLVESLLAWIPSVLRRRGCSGALFQGAAFGAIAGFVLGFLLLNHEIIQHKTLEIGEGSDAFWVPQPRDARGVEVKAALGLVSRYVGENQTIAVAPQGLLINYLTRHENPGMFGNLMEPEIISAGQDVVLRDLQSKPPDYVLFTLVFVDRGEFTLERDHYGRDICQWLIANYTTILEDTSEKSSVKFRFSRYTPKRER